MDIKRHSKGTPCIGTFSIGRLFMETGLMNYNKKYRCKPIKSFISLPIRIGLEVQELLILILHLENKKSQYKTTP